MQPVRGHKERSVTARDLPCMPGLSDPRSASGFIRQSDKWASGLQAVPQLGLSFALVVLIGAGTFSFGPPHRHVFLAAVTHDAGRESDVGFEHEGGRPCETCGL